MKKRIGAVLCLSIMFVFAGASFALAGQGDLKLEDTYPRNGATGTAVENLSVKLYFNEGIIPKNKAIRAANEKAFKMTDEKGKRIPIKVLYSHKEKGMMMILSETMSGSKNTIKGNTEYTLSIDPSFVSESGDELGKAQKVAFKTLDQQKNGMINMGMMVVMMVGMIFFSSRSMKKQMEKEQAAKGKTDTVNPYKEAKRTGKSVEEIVEKDRKNKEKQAAAKAKQDAKRKKELEEEAAEKRENSHNKRVSGPRPVSAENSKYVAKRKADAAARKAKNTTRPKNQTGKQKNKKKK